MVEGVSMRAKTTSILGNGVYSFSEAGRLLGVHAQTVRAWFKGWGSDGSPVLCGDYAEIAADRNLISFLDLVDVLVTSKLRESNVSLPTIRKAYLKLCKQFKTSHPFGRQELLTDETGRVFLGVARDEGDRILIDIIKEQHAFPSILEPYLKRIQYDPTTCIAQLLRLNDDGVILDPGRKYGQPIVETNGLPTALLAAAYEANGEDAEIVAEWYRVEPSEVEVAVRFEAEFAGLAA